MADNFKCESSKVISKGFCYNPWDSNLEHAPCAQYENCSPLQSSTTEITTSTISTTENPPDHFKLWVHYWFDYSLFGIGGSFGILWILGLQKNPTSSFEIVPNWTERHWKSIVCFDWKWSCWYNSKLDWLRLKWHFFEIFE